MRYVPVGLIQGMTGRTKKGRIGRNMREFLIQRVGALRYVVAVAAIEKQTPYTQDGTTTGTPVR